MDTVFISNFSQLKSIETKANITLAEDIDCDNAEVEFLAKLFKGKLDGNGHRIKNLVLTSEIWSDGQVLALFQYLDHATIENVIFDNLIIKADLDGYKPKISALCHESMHSKIKNVHIKGHLIGCKDVPMIDTALKGTVEDISFECEGIALKNISYDER